MKNTAIMSAITLLMLSIGTSAQAGGDAAAGKAKAATCAGCHGATGISQMPLYPNLAGQKQDYLAKSITAYKDGTRNDPTMKAMVSALSDADIQNLSAYFSSLGCK